MSKDSKDSACGGTGAGKSSADIARLESAVKKGIGHGTAKAEAFKGKEGVSSKESALGNKSKK